MFIKGRLIFYISAKKEAKDSVVDRVITMFAGFSIKCYVFSEISSSMEKLIGNVNTSLSVACLTEIYSIFCRYFYDKSCSVRTHRQTWPYFFRDRAPPRKF